MKYKIHRLVAIALSVILLLSCMPTCVFAETEDRLTLVQVPLYYFSSTVSSDQEVGFCDAEQQIPFMSMTEAFDVLQGLGAVIGDPYRSYTLDREANIFTISRENGSFVRFNGDTGEVYINNVQGLRVLGYAANEGDLVCEMGFAADENGEIIMREDGTPACCYIERGKTQYNMVRTGYNLVCNLPKEYGIDLIMQNDDLYIPVATINDLFMSGCYILYNGESLFLTGIELDESVPNEEGLTLRDIYYSNGSCPRSKALAEFTYNELCMFLDLNYGLASEHNIDGFQDFCKTAGLVNDLCDTDGATFETALTEILQGYCDDQHSKFIANSPYTGDVGKLIKKEESNFISSLRSDEVISRFTAARQAAGLSEEDETGCDVIKNAYCEVGDTAYITFDEFKYYLSDYYCMTEEELDETYAQDTVGLVIYANRQINRENSPVRKVVVDLSLNGGGVVDACIYIAAWMMGKAQLNIMNPITKSTYTNFYTADVDLDGYSGEEGDYLDLNKLDVYCLINDCSFSCGNLLPNMLKEDGRVTLIGQTSGGGACSVQFGVTADGAMFRCSSFYKLCTVKNGVYYSIDQGVVPDIPLRKPESYYNHEWLSGYLDTIY